MPARVASKLLIVGWDAADWKIIDPLLQRGGLPNLARLIASGLRGDLSSLDPKLSPLLWTSIATGKTADKHGILNFIEPEPSGSGVRISRSTTRRVKALWNILSQSGLRTNVVNWYATHPAEPINGVVVSNLFQEGVPSGPGDHWPLVAGAVHPMPMAEPVAGVRLHPRELGGEELLSMLPDLRAMDHADRRVQLLARLVAQCASVHNAATLLLSSGEPWDCTMVFYETIDVAGHHFMQYYPPRMAHVSERDFEAFRHVITGVYHLQDAMLGVLMELAGPDTAVIVMSDHGFHSDHLRPAVQPSLDDAHAAMDATWHRPLGMLAMAGPGLNKGGQVYGANLLDVAPTALTLLGVAVGADMDGRVLVEAFERPPEIQRVFSWDDLPGEAGLHPADVRQDPFETGDALKQLADLGYIDAPGGESRAQVELLARETKFNLAVVYLTTRRVLQAIPLLEELVAQRPDEPRYALSLAQCLHDVRRYAEARRVIEGFIARHPSNADARLHLGAALLAEGKPEEAGAALEEAERSFGGRTDLDVLLGTAYAFMRRYDDADRVFSRAVGVDPHDPRTHHGMALVSLGRRQFERAAEHALRAAELMHFYPDAHYTLGVALTWMQDFQHAIRSFKVALSMQPGMIDAHRYLASIYRHLRDRPNAATHRDAAMQLMKDRKQGVIRFEEREAPMGPQEWARRLGQPDETEADS